ncbi:MAG TPA: tetratricopeptide repeat protein, partial [Novosphingobium sp.]|nr:tetratricopeptide repeat protein [Novosphingobium sp.]
MRKVIGALAVVAGGNASNSTPAHGLRGRRRFGGGLLAGVMLAGALAGSAPAQAQGLAQMGAQGAAQLPAAASAPAVSREVVQPLPTATDPSRALNSALMQLARDPRDPEALLSAGESALAMGDVQAAIGFLTRAERLTPNNQRVLTALGGARLRSQDPVAALEAFDAAARLGPLSAEQLSDQALSHDLVGDNPPAQRLYREALAKGAGDEAARRLALSLAIVGDRRGVDMVLAPMLQKQDRSAWRIRAFAFAIMGREDEAVAIASTTMPADLANGMAPYLRYMRRLTPAQQAAAANLGFFPQASQIGQEDPRIAAYASLHGIRHTTFAEPELASAVDARARGAKAEPRRTTRRVREDGEARSGEARSSEARSGESRAAEARGATASTAAQGGEMAPPVPAPSRESQPAAPVELVARPVAAPAARPAAPAPRPAVPAAATPSFSSLPAGGSGFDLASVNNGGAARPATQAAPGAQRAGGVGEVARAEAAAQT